MNRAARDHPAKSEVPHPIQKTFDLINAHLYCVEERIRAQAREFDPAIEGYVAYAVESNGKRLRPALAILAGAVTGGVGPGHLDLAVIVELIHAATLVHDDIMDGAEIRRNQPTANAKWGNTISVLLGDCLFAHALKLATGFHNVEIGRRIAAAANEVCAGEIIQTQRRFDLKLPVAEYHRIIGMKTAALFAAAAELGALLNEADPGAVAAMKTFGTKLGTAYQIYDDCLDLAGSEASAGKTLGTDLRKGKLTLPILLLLEGATATQHQRLSEIILAGSDAGLATLAETAKALGALKAAVETAQQLIGQARDALTAVPHNQFRDGLRGLCDALHTMVGRLAS